ncbi:MAG: D-aminoacyl-tRNA deacylase, partial [Acetanaerobacterium sp.]
MRAVLQRVSWAKVEIGGNISGEIGKGFLLLLGISPSDGENEASLLAQKASGLRVFEDEDGKMNRSLADTGGGMLIVPNFTLYADTSHGRRPSFMAAARPEHARPLYERFV